MQNFSFKKYDLEGLALINPFYVRDERGYFLKSYEKDIFKENGIETDIFETFESLSYKNVLRGLHFQTENPQSKIVRCVKGQIFDVAVDIRINSPTFGQWRGEMLNEENNLALYIPKGFAHGFLVLSDIALTTYTCSGKYSKGTDSGIVWNDKDIGIDWPIKDISSFIISERDKQLQTLKEFSKKGFIL